MNATQPEDLLFSYARQGDVEGLLRRIAEGADINGRDLRGFTPLMAACYNGQLEAARLLLKAGADINLPDAGGNTALMGVCFKGYPEIARLLKERVQT